MQRPRELHVIFGAGSVGSAAARILGEAGHQVRAVSRSGGGPAEAGIERVAADAADIETVRRLSEGATAIYNCMNPAYTRWASDWPPLADALLAAAQSSGAVLATVSNLYPYGLVHGPMSEATPERPRDVKAQVRATMWARAKAAHDAGHVRAVEVRGSDYADAGVNSHLSRHTAAVMAGQAVWVVGSADRSHSWTATADVARLLVLAAADPTAHGRTWLVPSAPPRTQRQALADLATAARARPPRVHVLTPAMIRAVGVFSPSMRELSKVSYQFSNEFHIDDSAARAHFGMKPQPWADTIAGILDQARGCPVSAPLATDATAKSAGSDAR